MPERLSESPLWEIQGTLADAHKQTLPEAEMERFFDEFIELVERHGLRFNGGWKPLSEAEIDGEDDA